MELSALVSLKITHTYNGGNGVSIVSCCFYTNLLIFAGNENMH